MSMVYVVLGMHRSGTSLVSSMLRTAGVPMCVNRCGGHDATQPYGYHEDVDFVDLNRLILARARGNWHNPPQPWRVIDAAGPLITRTMRSLVQKRSTRYPEWGWKDPRNALTCFAWHPVLLLENCTPFYIVVQRRKHDIVDSLLRRHEGTSLGDRSAQDWSDLVDTYWLHIRVFFERYGAIRFNVSYERLMGSHAADEVAGLAGFVGAPGKVLDMMARIQTGEDQ